MGFIQKYPKLLLLGYSFVAAYLLYHYGFFDVLEKRLNGHGYVSAFLGGLLFSFGFTSPFGIAIFVEIADHVHPLIAAPLGGLGAFLMDLCIFELMRFETFHDELYRLRNSLVFRKLHALLHHEGMSDRIRQYVLWSFAGLIIASPLPDEVGISLVSGITNIESRKFGIICFGCNTLGILLILLLVR